VDPALVPAPTALLPAPTALLPAPTALASSSDYFRAVVARGQNRVTTSYIGVELSYVIQLKTSLGHPTRSPHFTRPLYARRLLSRRGGARAKACCA